MIVIICLVAGLLFGWFRAARREGNRFDRIQYALVHAIIFGLAGTLATIILARMT
jgi:hypothetical protein